MQRNNTPLILIAALLGLLGLIGAAFLILAPRGNSGPPPGTELAAEPTPTPAAIWVAARNIPPRTRLTRDMMRQSFTSTEVPEDAVREPEQVVGLLVQKAIRYGEPVRTSALSQSLGRVIPANFGVPSGLRAVAVYIDPESTAGGLVDVGDRVDVVAVHRLELEKEPGFVISGARQFSTGRTIATNLEVLAVDRSLDEQPTPTPPPLLQGSPSGGDAAGQPAAGEPAPPPPPPAAVPASDAPQQAEPRTRVIVAAPPAVAERLVAANDQGELHLTIRNPGDADAEVPAEAREYPSRLVFTGTGTSGAGSNNAGSGSGAGSAPRAAEARSGFSEPPLPPVRVNTDVSPVIEAPSSRPIVGPAGRDGQDGRNGRDVAVPSGLPGPSPAESEVTVIRGTEKTRVIVPQR